MFSAFSVARLLPLTLAAGLLIQPARAQWASVRINTPAPIPAISDIHFPDALHGWAVCGGGTTIRTTDGGRTWTEKPTRLQSSLRDVYFVNPDTGYAVGNIGVIVRTMDGGQTWTRHDLANTGSSVNGVYFHDVKHGYVTQGDQIYATADGGSTWRVVFTYNGTLSIFTFRFLEFADSLTGYAVGGYSGSFGNVGEVARTTDGGQTWRLINSAAGSTPMGAAAAVAFPTPTTGYVADVQGRLFRTANGGQSWQIVSQNTFGAFYGMAFTDSLTGFGGGDGGNLRMTTDGGQTWVDQHVSTTDLYASLSFPTPTVGYAAGAFNNSADAGIVRYTAAPSATPRPAGADALLVWPNPAREAVQVANLPAGQPATLRLTDLQGREVRHQALAGATGTRLSTAGLSPGCYLLRVQAGEHVWSQKLVVE